THRRDRARRSNRIVPTGAVRPKPPIQQKMAAVIDRGRTYMASNVKDPGRTVEITNTLATDRALRRYTPEASAFDAIRRARRNPKASPTGSEPQTIKKA